jgi:hypothetical protein
MDRPVAFVERAADGDVRAFGKRIVEQPFDTGEVLRMDYLGDVFLPDAAVLRVEIFLDAGAKGFGQFVFLLFPNQQVVRTDAGLATVELLCGRKLGRDLLYIGTLVDDDRRLAAELERNRREMLRGGRHDELADARAAREEDVIERQLEQSLCNVDTTFEQRDVAFVECFPNNLCGHGRGCRAQVRQLGDAAIAGGDGGRKWTEHETEWKIPRTEDQADAARFMDDPGPVVAV